MIAIACAIGFSLTNVAGLSGSQQEVLVGVCFFLASVSSMCFYFGYKAALLLSGASLNAQFKIVKKNDDRGKGHDKERTPTNSATSSVCMPQNIPDCEAQILLLQGQLMILLEKAVNAYSGSASLSQSGKCPSLMVHRDIELHSSIENCSQNEYKVVEKGGAFDAQRKFSAKNRGTVQCMTGKLCTVVK